MYQLGETHRFEYPGSPYCNALEEIRARNEETPLREGAYLESDGLSLYTTSPRRNEVRNASRPCIPDLLERGVNLRLRVIEPIQTGTDRLSQVWRCTYSSLNHQGSEESSVVILKLFQESLRFIPHESLIDYIPVEEDITRESHAYQQLRGLQGSILPYSYGFYNFTLPCGEIVVGHVMEFISGDQLDKRAKDSVHDLGELQRLYISTLSAFHTLRQNEVRHGDVKLRNIMAHSPPGMDPPEIVLVDFGSSRIFTDTPLTKECLCRDIDNLLWACLDVPELARAARTWIVTHLNDPMLEGLNYEVRPFEPSCYNEDDRPIIVRSEKKFVIPAVSNTEEVPDESKEPFSGIWTQQFSTRWS
ncbi:hypothetical protein M422DRAFT_71420 [Sphaerobolus stellatus SS14]|uniref:Protein kinase domain-containing protein n=1 Tax=Sphaerobolus stellatus (strain SS14) TaxID=990650 RepID=A0A0C9UHN4_SPHS4|nr:hypothetical protein M422DRAFT_71420 [Sphaerobolus stellatus SS14]